MRFDDTNPAKENAEYEEVLCSGKWKIIVFVARGIRQ